MNIIRKHLKKKSFENIPLTKHSIYRKHHASDDTVKEFKSEWKVWVEYPDAGGMEEESAKFWEEFYDEAKKCAESSFESSKEIILDVAKEEIPTIKDMEFRLTPETAIMKVTYSEKPTDKILKSTADYLEGQYADGWGEGLEQQEFDTFEEQIDVGYEDEETGEYIEDYETGTGRLYVKLWSSRDFKMDY